MLFIHGVSNFMILYEIGQGNWLSIFWTLGQDNKLHNSGLLENTDICKKCRTGPLLLSFHRRRHPVKNDKRCFGTTRLFLLSPAQSVVTGVHFVRLVLHLKEYLHQTMPGNLSRARDVAKPGHIRAVWKIQKFQFSKSQRRFRTTSQHWFQNSWRNHHRTIRLLLN